MYLLNNIDNIEYIESQNINIKKYMLDKNVHIFDVRFLAFRRFYDEVFSKFWSIKSVTDTRMKDYDFYQTDYQVKLYDTSFSGLATLYFRYN